MFPEKRAGMSLSKFDQCVHENNSLSAAIGMLATTQLCAMALQDKLIKHQESHVDAASSQTQLADLDGQIEAAEQRILSLKKTVLQNDANINKLLHMSVGVV